MEIKLAENIRLYRKRRNLTQEQLAQVLNVTVGAVHKWETQLSTPEIALIAEMADFFGVSVDALLGFEMKDNGPKATVERLKAYWKTMDPGVLDEAERVLKRFPNSFEIVYGSACSYMIFGGRNHEKKQLNRALELFEKSLVLLPQSGAQEYVSADNIYSNMAYIRLWLGQSDQAAALLKEHNKYGCLDDHIGLILSVFCRRPAEAQSYLTQSVLNTAETLYRTVIGQTVAYVQLGDLKSAREFLLWGSTTLEGLQKPGSAGFFDRILSQLYMLHSYVYLRLGSQEEAKSALLRARTLARSFDASPEYGVKSLRFVSDADDVIVTDMLGNTALDSLTFLIQVIGDDPLSALWKEINENEE